MIYIMVNNTKFSLSQLYSVPQFLIASFLEVNYNERAFITIKENKRRSSLLQSCFL